MLLINKTHKVMVTLTKGEEKIMKILWDIKKGFIKDIIEEYPNPKLPYNSVSTIVKVLVQKEIIGYKAYGKFYQYYPLVSKEDYSKWQMKRLVTDYYNNSLSQVVSFFTEIKQLKESELDEAIRMLEVNKKQKRTLSFYQQPISFLNNLTAKSVKKIGLNRHVTLA